MIRYWKYQELQETQRSFKPSVLFDEDENIFEQQLKVFWQYVYAHVQYIFFFKER
jgi:hypothetical protein